MPEDATRWWQRKKIARAHGPKWLAALLRDLEREQSACGVELGAPPPSAAWLIRYRPRIRRLHQVFPAAILSYLKQCPDSMKPIAIWLLGRCVLRTEHLGLFEFAVQGPPAARRHAARALRRIEAWEKLRTLAKLNPNDEKISWYANAPFTKRGFRERLRNYAEHVDHSHAAEAAGPSRMALWFADLDWIRRPPKPVEFMRRILERIHRMVHGTD